MIAIKKQINRSFLKKLNKITLIVLEYFFFLIRGDYYVFKYISIKALIKVSIN